MNTALWPRVRVLRGFRSDSPYGAALPEDCFQPDMAGGAAVFQNVQQNLYGFLSHLSGRLDQGGQGGEGIGGNRQTVDGNDGTVLRHLPAVVMQSLDGGNGKGIGQGKNCRELGAAVQEGVHPGIGVLNIKPSVGTFQQRRVKGNPVIGKGGKISVAPQLTDGPVIPAGDQGDNAAVTQVNEMGHSPVGGFVVIYGDGGVAVRVQRAEHIGIGAAHIGDTDGTEFRRGIVKPTPQKDQALKLFFPFQHGAGFDFIGIGGDLPQHHGIACPVNLPGDGFQHFGEEQVSAATDNDTDGIGMAADQVSGAVVGDIAAGFHNSHYPLPDGLADIWTVIQHTGDGTDADSAYFRNIFDRHGGTTFTRDPGRRIENVPGNVFNNALLSYHAFQKMSTWTGSYP